MDKRGIVKNGIIAILIVVFIITIGLSYAFTFVDDSDTDFSLGNFTTDVGNTRVVGTGAGANVTINISSDANQTENLFGRGIEVNESVVLYLRFEEGTGQYANDSSQYGNNGTLGATTASATDDPQWNSSAKFENFGLSFNGDDYVNISDSDDWAFGTDDFTIEAWAKPDNVAAGNDRIYSQHQDGDNRVQFGFVSTTVQFYVEDANVVLMNFAPSFTAKDNTWHHLAVSRAGDDFTMYVDGVSIGSTTDTDSIPNLAAPVLIGTYSGETVFYDGIIDEFVIWNISLTNATILEHYQKGWGYYNQSNFTSQTFEANAVANWTTISWAQEIPYQKEIGRASGDGLCVAEDSLITIVDAVVVEKIESDNNINIYDNKNKEKENKKRGSRTDRQNLETGVSPRVIDNSHDRYINVSLLDNAKVPELVDGLVSKTSVSPRGVGVRTSTSEIPLLGDQKSYSDNYLIIPVKEFIECQAKNECIAVDYITSKKKIKDIKAGEYVKSLDEKTGKLVTNKVKALLDMGNKTIYELTTVSGRAVNTTATHPYLVKLYSKELCSRYAGDVWNAPLRGTLGLPSDDIHQNKPTPTRDYDGAQLSDENEFNEKGYCTRWVEVKDLDEGYEIAVPKIKDYSTSNNFLMSSVDKISTSDCSLNLFSLDQIAQAEDNANAKYGISFACPGNSFKALDSNFLNSSLGTTSIISDSNEKDTMNSNPPMPQNLQIFCFNKYNSSNAKSGAINLAPLRYSDLSRFLVKDARKPTDILDSVFGTNYVGSGLKNENNMLASTTINLICNAPAYEDIPYLLAKLSLYSSTSSEKLSSDSLLFFNISSTALNKSNTLSFSSTAPLNNDFVESFLSSSPIISLNLSDILNFNSVILSSPIFNSENGYLKVSDNNYVGSIDSELSGPGDGDCWGLGDEDCRCLGDGGCWGLGDGGCLGLGDEDCRAWRLNKAGFGQRRVDEGGLESQFSDENSDIVFEKIVSIRVLDKQQVYDLDIENTDNFIANDIIAHNTATDEDGFVNTTGLVLLMHMNNETGEFERKIEDIYDISNEKELVLYMPFDSANAEEIIPNGSTVLLMHFNNDTGSGENASLFYSNATDSDGNNINNGTCNLATSLCPVFNESNTRLGKAALEFDGADDFINITKSKSLNVTGAVTVAAWVKSDSAGRYIIASDAVVKRNITFQPASEGFDTMSTSSSPNNNNGGVTVMEIGSDSTPADRRGWIKFNLSAIPAGVTVTSVTLSLYESVAQGAGPRNGTLVRVLKDWVESEATWNDYSTGNSWTTAGARASGDDVSATISAIANLSFDGNPLNDFISWSSTQLAADVQDMINDGDSNYGWLLNSSLEGTASRTQEFKSSDHSTASVRPKLLVNYTVPVFPFAINTTNGGGFEIRNGTNGTLFGVADNDGDINDGQWHFIVGTYDGTTMRLYVDGALKSTSTDYSGDLPELQGDVWIGADYNMSPNRFFNGTLDEVAAWNVTLSPEVIAKMSGYGIDKSIYGNNATLMSGTAVNFTNPKFGEAMWFDGVDDYVEIPDSDDWAFGTDDFAIEAWVKPDSQDGSDRIYSQHVDNNNRVQFGIDTTAFQFAVVDGGSVTINIEPSYTFSDNTWYHLAVTRAGNDFTLYVDGASIGGGTDDSTVPNLATTLRIGEYISGFFDGSIDEFAVWNRSLSADEIAEHAGVKVLDYSGFGNNGTRRNLVNFTADGKFGPGLEFDGKDDYVNISNVTRFPEGNSPRTVMAWIKPKGFIVDEVHAVVGAGTRVNGKDFIFGTRNVDGFSRAFVSARANGDINGPTALDVDTWYHIAATADDAGQLELFLNGLSEGTSIPATFDTVVDSGIIIGDVTKRNAPFNGTIDEVAFWNRTLSQKEIQNIYKRGVLKLNLSYRTSNDSTTFSAWKGVSNNSLSTVGEQARYLEYKAVFNTTDNSWSPVLHNVSIVVDSTCPCPSSGDWNIRDVCTLDTTCSLDGSDVYITSDNNLTISDGGLRNFGNVLVYGNLFCRASVCFG